MVKGVWLVVTTPSPNPQESIRAEPALGISRSGGTAFGESMGTVKGLCAVGTPPPPWALRPQSP